MNYFLLLYSFFQYLTMKLIFDNTKFGSLNVSSRIIRNGCGNLKMTPVKSLTQEVFDRYEKRLKTMLE